MKHAIYIMLLTLLSTTAYGRLGETPEECKTRYGPPVEQVRPPAEADYMQSMDYRKDQYGVLIGFLKETDNEWHANLLVYSKKGGIVNKLLSAREVQAFLDANAQGSSWQEVNQWDKALATTNAIEQQDKINDYVRKISWTRSDGKAFATYDKVEDSLMINTAALLQQIRNRHKDPLNGF